MNKYQYETVTGSKKGRFNIYQARNGKIILMMGNGYTELNLRQIEDLNIDLYELKDFSIDDYKKAYTI